MAESLVQLPEWAYQALDTDSKEVKEAAENSDNHSLLKVDVKGKLTNNEPCQFIMDINGNSCNIYQTEITRVRSCLLKKVGGENGDTKYGVQISTMIGVDFVWFLILFESLDDTMKVLNICRRSLHSKGGYIDYLCPKWTGSLEIQVSTLQGSSDDIPEESYTIILDEEAFFLFRDFNKRLPDFFLMFYKEGTDHSIERALVQHYSNNIVLESVKMKFVIKNAVGYSSFTEAIKMIKPKPKHIFEDHSKIAKYLTDLEQINHDENVSQELQKRQENPSGSRYRQDYETEWGEQSKTSEAGNQASIISRELDQALESLSVNEDLSLPWIVAEDEMKLMLENPEALEGSQTDMLSGGLDPNDANHLMKSFSEIKEHLTSQRYDLALSRLKGTKTVFQESAVPEIKRLIGTDELELLKKLYFHSFIEGL
ncbi:unnamed protein product [Mytilus coruscus]|uniref:Uncharacterized protein n=1 Tax=Mytilus coruscus TaxID=42192 RepID=A0A6J8EKJ4_MYTCO|nr:unnamed protein product [Mytilus coruscus]